MSRRRLFFFLTLAAMVALHLLSSTRIPLAAP